MTMNMEFNESFNEEGQKPDFIYKRNPLAEHCWQVFQFFPEKDNYEPVGEYVLVDLNEDVDITEKKLINLVGVMNGKRRLIDFTNLTKTRILYNIVTGAPEDKNYKVVFREYDGTGVSKENAVLTIEKGVFYDEAST